MSDARDPVPAEAAPERWSDWPLVIALTLLGLAIRWLLLPLVVWPPVDAVHYLTQAMHGPWGTTWSPVGGTWFLPPLYPALVALLSGASVEPALTMERAKLASLLVGTLTVPALYWAIRPVLGQAIGRWTLLLAAVDPLMAHYSAVVISEPLYLLLLVLLLGAAVRWARGWATGAVLAAVLGLAAYLTRAFGVVLFPLAYAGVWWTRTGFKQPAGAFCRESAIACALFTIGAAGYIALVTARVGHFAWDGKSRHQFIRLAAPNLTLEERDPNYEGLVDASGLRYAPDTPWFEPLQGPAKITGAVRKYAMRHQRIWLRWLTDTVPPYGVPLFAGVTLLLVGAGAALVRPYVLSPGWRVWGALGVGIALVQPLTFIEIRYFVWLVPLALPLAAVALDRLAHWLKGRAPQGIDPKLLPAALALVVAGYNMLAIQPSLRKIADEDHRKNPYTAVAATIRDAPIPAPLAILDTSGIAAYYLGVPGYVIPDVPPERLAPFAEAQGASALVLDEQLARTKHNRVLLQFLYDVPADYPEYGLWLLGQGDPAPGKGWRVYTFIPPPGTLQGSP